jgi:hypothetical protein
LKKSIEECDLLPEDLLLWKILRTDEVFEITKMILQNHILVDIIDVHLLEIMVDKPIAIVIEKVIVHHDTVVEVEVDQEVVLEDEIEITHHHIEGIRVEKL